MQYNSEELTRLLNESLDGNKISMDKILPIVYNELKKISSNYLQAENINHTLQTTELVHEVYLKLIGSQKINWESRAHFFGIAARMMREILVDHARKKNSQKRGDGAAKLSLDDSLNISDEFDGQILALDEALKKLERIEERPSKIVELRFFSGLSIEETAALLNISPATAKRDWVYAKAWLYREIQII